MIDATDGNRRSSRWPEGIAVALSILALLVSGYSLVAARRQHEDERATELLTQLYDDWDQLVGSDLWEVSHLAEVPETYRATRDLLRSYATGLSAQDRRRVLLLERSAANRIFNAFELSFRQWEIAEQAGDDRRRAMLDQEMDYWTGTYLRNPRLLWYWAEEGGGLVGQMDPPTIEFYERRVPSTPDEWDPVGIIPSDPVPGEG